MWRAASQVLAEDRMGADLAASPADATEAALKVWRKDKPDKMKIAPSE